MSELLNAPPLWLEMRSGSIHVFNGAVGEDFAIETDSEGRIDEASQARVLETLRRLGPRKPWQARGELWCAIPARGVSIRRFTMPAAKGEEFRRQLRLQVEAHFPTPPEQLAWGSLSDENMRTDAAQREVAVVAVRRASLAPWVDLFTRAGYEPVFTLAALVRASPTPASTGSFASLEVTSRGAELVCLQDGLPTLVRTIPWGLNQLRESQPAEAGVTVEELERCCEALGRGESVNAARQVALTASVTPLAESLRRLWTGSTLEVLAPPFAAPFLAHELSRRLAPAAATGRVEPAWQPGQTAAVLGMVAAAAGNRLLAPVRLDLTPTSTSRSRNTLPAAPLKWGVRIGALLAAMLLLPYGEAFVGRPLLVRRLAALRKDQARLAEIDRRLEFLQFLAANESPYIDAAYVIANAAPPGVRVDSLAMNRRGEVSFNGYTQMPPQVVDFRSKLADSRFFSSVVVEEQSPLQGGMQRVNFRISAQWRGPVEREGLSLGPVLPEEPKANPPAIPNDVNSLAAPPAGGANSPVHR